MNDISTKSILNKKEETLAAIKSGKLDPATASVWDINGDGMITQTEVNDAPALCFDVIPAGVSGTEYDASDPYGSVITSDDTLAVRYGNLQSHDTLELTRLFDGDITEDWTGGNTYTAEIPGLTVILEALSNEDYSLTFDVTDPSTIRMGFAKGFCVQRTFVIDTNNDGVPDIDVDSSWLEPPSKVNIKIGGQSMTLAEYILANPDRGIGEIVGWDSATLASWDQTAA